MRYYSIIQNTETIFTGDKTSMYVIFNSLTGQNFESEDEHKKYVDNVFFDSYLYAKAPFRLTSPTGLIIKEGTLNFKETERVI